MKGLWILAALLIPGSVRADCGFQERLLERGRGLLARERFLLATGPLTAASLEGCSAPLAQRATLGLALSLQELGESEEATRLLHELEPQIRPELAGTLRVVWAWVEPARAAGLSVDERTRWERWEARANDPRLLEARAKRPWLAGSLSAVLPGAGQAYVGAWQSAALSLLLNSLFLAATAQFATHDLAGPAVASGLVFSVTYLGNVWNAVSAARRLNRNQSAPIEAELKKNLFPELSP